MAKLLLHLKFKIPKKLLLIVAGVLLIAFFAWLYSFMQTKTVSVTAGVYRAGDRTYNVFNVTATLTNYSGRAIRVTADDTQVISSNGQVAGPVVWFDEFIQPFAAKTIPLQFNLISGDYPEELVFYDRDLNNYYRKTLSVTSNYQVQGVLNTKAELDQFVFSDNTVRPTVTLPPALTPTPVPIKNITSNIETDRREMVAALNLFAESPVTQGRKVTFAKLGLDAYVPITNEFYYHETQPLSLNDEGEGTYETYKDCFHLGPDKLTPGSEEMYCKYYALNYRFYSANRWVTFGDSIDVYLDSYPRSFTSLLDSETGYLEETVGKFGQTLTIRYFTNDNFLSVICTVLMPNGHTAIITAEISGYSQVEDLDLGRTVIKAVIESLELSL